MVGSSKPPLPPQKQLKEEGEIADLNGWDRFAFSRRLLKEECECASTFPNADGPSALSRKNRKCQAC